jgi:hypothetical protein
MQSLQGYPSSQYERFIVVRALYNLLTIEKFSKAIRERSIATGLQIGKWRKHWIEKSLERFFVLKIEG